MTLMTATIFFIVSLAGIAVSAVCLRGKKIIRIVFTGFFAVAALAFAAYIALTFIFVGAAANSPADAVMRF